MKSMGPISAVLLAAGQSQRMGKTNKMGLLVNGEPLLRRTARILLESDFVEIVVVTGYRASEAQNILRGLPLRTVLNPLFSEGQTTSVRCGIAALGRRSSGVMVCLADQPLLERSDIQAVDEAFHYHDCASAIVPTYRGKRGNPIIIPQTMKEEILSKGFNIGCRHIIDNNPGKVISLEMENDHTVFDLDSPEDCDTLQERIGACSTA